MQGSFCRELQPPQGMESLATTNGSRRTDRAVRENLQVVVIGIHTAAPLTGDFAQHAEAFQQFNHLACR